ncbi:hypothetical protein LCGC14_1155400 [marine sediment metagenome]|uniref:Uncharacterized protein n=1 Tax=marine sediment metagenome TaxID=412755 RepID=A0A0F9LU70_9ZZZZ
MRKDRTIGKYWPILPAVILALLLAGCAGKPWLSKALTYEAVSAVYNTADVYWHGVRKVWAKAEITGQITVDQHNAFKEKSKVVVLTLAVVHSGLVAFKITDEPANLNTAYAAVGELSQLFLAHFLEAQALKLNIETPPSLEMR